ncbi:MAG: winged helix-turn-helix transcriptional regulator [Desulfovibrio sp.]|nr:winged helix-turn-helix transcriptional regulator [Desulfovibrio sp.]MBI4961223.1 winged helix-turn-helix transcriptional regulator [Desulfovibrio sp.]
MKSIALLFKALTDETRLRIVNLLSQGELCVCDLTHALNMPQSTVSRHLATLKNAGVVTDRRCRTWAYYRLSDAVEPFAREVLQLLAKHMGGIEEALADSAALKGFRLSPDRNCEQAPKRGAKQ